MEGVLIAVEVGKVATLVDGSVSITLRTQELPALKAAELFGLRKRVAFAYIKPDKEPTENERKALDGMLPEPVGKTPSQRLRGVIYVYWEQNKDSDPTIPKDFETFYRIKIESFIEGIKQELV